ncbi:helix-turn-helix domain-containing protein [Ekhidna sp.]
MKTEIYFNLHPINFFIVSGIVQIFILSGILIFSKADNKRSNRLLAFLILVVNLHLTYLMLLDLNLDNLFPWLLWIPYSFLLAIGPLLFFYTCSFTRSGFKLSKKEMLHFVPLGIELILQLFQICWAILSREIYYNVPTDRIITPLIYVSASISIFYYLRRSMKEIESHEKLLVQQFSEIRKKTLQWLIKLLEYYRLFWLIWIPFAVSFLILFRGQIQNVFTIAVTYFLLTLLTYLTYWVGLQGLKKGFVMNIGDLIKNIKGGYHHLAQSEISELIAAIKTEMEKNDLFMNATLSLKEFASVLAKDPNLVSFVINTHLKKSFFELVNSYRIEAVKQRLMRNDGNRFTLLAIALECGFNSKTSFNRVFKEMTGDTPSQYLRKVSKN